MNIAFRFVLIVSASILSCNQALAQQRMPEPNWSRGEALHAAAQVDANVVLKPLYRMAREGQNERLLESLAEIEQRSEWPIPAREYLLHVFATGLADLEREAVGQAVLDYLASYESRAWVPHEDRPGVGVPLFNIRAAAAGSISEWARQSAALEAAALFTDGSANWLDAYLESDAPGRRGYIDALQNATRDQLDDLGSGALHRLPAEPSLTAVSTRIALTLGDTDLFRQSLVSGTGQALAPALREASRVFGDDEILAIIAHAIDYAPPGTAALAMAELARPRLGQSVFEELLFDTLDNATLGAAAALLLSSSGDPLIRARLERLALRDNGLSARRAEVALRAVTENEGTGGAR